MNYVEVDVTTLEGQDGDEDGTITEDEETATVPDTGDHNMPQMLLALMLVSLLGMVVVSKKRVVKQNYKE